MDMHIAEYNTTGRTLEDFINNFYDDNPFVRLMGIKIDSIDTDNGSLEIHLDLQPEHTNVYQIAHGGVLMTMADMAMGGSCLAVGKKVVTLDMNINIIRPIVVGESVWAKGSIVHNGRSTVVAEVELKNSQGQLSAKARGTFYVVGVIKRVN